MPSCVAINIVGTVCGVQNDFLERVHFYDPLGRIDKSYFLCSKHATLILEQLMETENAYANLIKALHIRMKKIDNEIWHGDSVAEQRQKINDARNDGLPEPRFKNIGKLKIEKNILWDRIKRTKTIQVIQRNKLCRWCKYPLKEPEQGSQIGKKYGNVDFKGSQGYRRLDAMMHTECLMAYLGNKIKLEEKEMKFVLPKRAGQNTLFQ